MVTVIESIDSGVQRSHALRPFASRSRAVLSGRVVRTAGFFGRIPRRTRDNQRRELHDVVGAECRPKALTWCCHSFAVCGDEKSRDPFWLMLPFNFTTCTSRNWLPCRPPQLASALGAKPSTRQKELSTQVVAVNRPLPSRQPRQARRVSKAEESSACALGKLIEGRRMTSLWLSPLSASFPGLVRPTWLSLSFVPGYNPSSIEPPIRRSCE